MKSKLLTKLNHTAQQTNFFKAFDIVKKIDFIHENHVKIKIFLKKHDTFFQNEDSNFSFLHSKSYFFFI